MLLVILAAFAALPASAQTFPKFTGLVVDAANVIPADRKAALEQKLEAFQKQTQRQLVIATIPDLQGFPIEDYGYKLGRTWGVGLKDADNGVILIVAPADHKVRVEVGRRLEPVLTDALSSIIIRDKIVPAFKSGDMPGGIEAGTDALVSQLSLPDAQAQAEAAKAARDFDATHRRAKSGGGIPLGLIFWVFVVAFVLLAMRRGRSGAAGPWGQRSYGGDGGGNGWIWLWAASEAMRAAADHRDRSSGGGGIDGGGFWGGGGGGGGSDGSWGGGGFTGGGGGDFGGGGASGGW